MGTLWQDVEEAGLSEQVKSQVCDNVTLYAQKYAEEFSPFLSSFVTAIWRLLVTTGQEVKFDLVSSLKLGGRVYMISLLFCLFDSVYISYFSCDNLSSVYLPASRTAYDYVYAACTGVHKSVFIQHSNYTPIQPISWLDEHTYGFYRGGISGEFITGLIPHY